LFVYVRSKFPSIQILLKVDILSVNPLPANSPALTSNAVRAPTSRHIKGTEKRPWQITSNRRAYVETQTALGAQLGHPYDSRFGFGFTDFFLEKDIPIMSMGLNGLQQVPWS
jgi:hypothetical protein